MWPCDRVSRAGRAVCEKHGAVREVPEVTTLSFAPDIACLNVVLWWVWLEDVGLF